MKIKMGRKMRIRALTEKKILDLGANSPGLAMLVPARAAWKKLDWLVNEGFSKAELARRLGCKTPALQFNHQRMTLRNIRRVDRLYREITLE